MTNDKRPLELDDIYKTPVGDLLALSDHELEALIVSAEEAYQKARKLKAWLNGVKRQKSSRKK